MRVAIEASLNSGRDPALAVLTPQERVALKDLYEKDGHLPLWLDAEGRPNRSVEDALTVLNGAADEGLDPSDYRHPQFDRLLATAQDASPARLRDLAGFDLALSSNMLRYFHDVHSGRVDPRTLGLALAVPADTLDFAGLLHSAVANQRMTETVANLRPPLAQYGALRTVLTQYRSMAAPATAEAIPPFGAVVHPGDRYMELGILYRQLDALGDLPPGMPAPVESGEFDGVLVDGLKRFQIRHGLEADGVLGKRTQEALRIPLTWRVRQIELALERLRWLPHWHDERVLAINIPMFRLWAWDSIPATGKPSLGMDVIVGRARATQTPVFAAQLREVIFGPYWNVPASILRHEILPALERDPDYLRRQDMEIVRGPGDNAQAVEATADNLARLRQGALRLRQRPGPRNALGLVKFVFPNKDDVYMHGTPAPALFNRSRRDFSHGCVRVQDPVALAEWVLKDLPEWNRDQILSAMAGRQSLHVKLPQPIQVILFYTTAAVMGEDDTIRFADDIYGHDARLDRALTRRQFLN
jgi:murein L,D-transpeptidase YcbB/YkuD